MDLKGKGGIKMPTMQAQTVRGLMRMLVELELDWYITTHSQMDMTLRIWDENGNSKGSIALNKQIETIEKGRG